MLISTNTRTPPRHAVGLLFSLLAIALGAFLRVGAIQDTRVIEPFLLDAGDYAAYANNLVHHHTYSLQPFSPDASPPPDAVRPPVYPGFLSLILRLSPDNPLLFTQYMQVVLSVLSMALAWALFRRFLPPFWTNAGLFLVAICPHLIVSNVYLLTESFYTFGLLGTLMLLVWAQERNGWPSALLAGTALGLLTLTRAAVQYFIVVLVALFRYQGSATRVILALVLGFAIVFGSWTMRNISTLGTISDNTLMINFLHHGMYPDFRYQGRDATYGIPYRFDPKSADVSESLPTILAEIVRRFHEEPIRHLRWFLVSKPVVFWGWNSVQGIGDAYVYPVKSSPYARPLFQWTHRLARILHTPLVLLGLLGALTCWFWRPGQIRPSALLCVKLIAAMLIYYQLIHMIGAPFPRYSVPLRPLLYGMAMYSLSASVAVVQQLREHHTRSGHPENPPP